MSFFKIFSPTKIKDKLSKTSSKISSGISEVFTHKKLDDEILEGLEELLISSDMGVESSVEIVDHLRQKKFNKEITDLEIKAFLAEEIRNILAPCQASLKIIDLLKPQVIIFNGVNGVGKTTTIGKMAKTLSDSGKKVMIASCDTFRAAASEQLKIWADRSNCSIVLPIKEGEDPASVAYRSLKEAKDSQIDILFIDTAGRLHNKQNLMDELRKINDVLKKIDESAPHNNILVLDATNGQNVKNQLETFDKIVKISGLIITKLDGSAKGGILVSLAKKYKKPIHAIGVGEKIEDLQEFDADKFAKSLVDYPS